MEEGRLSIGGVNIHYGKCGNGSHNVLLLHDTPSSYSIEFERTLKEFDQEKLTLVGWDAPGLGRSRPPDRDHTHGYHEREARQAFELMETLNLLPFSIIAKGDGAQTALWLAYQQRENTHVSKMILWSTSAYISEHGVKRMDCPVRDTTLWADWKKKPYVDMYGEEYFQKVWSDYLDTKIAWHKDKKLKGNVCQQILKEIPQPTLLIFPENCFFYDEEEMDDLEEFLPNSGLMFAEEMYEDLHQKKFDWFKKTCERFLADSADEQFALVDEEKKRMEDEYYKNRAVQDEKDKQEAAANQMM